MTRTWPSPEIGELHGLCRRLNARVNQHLHAGHVARLSADGRLYEIHLCAAREVLGAYYEAEARLLRAIEEAGR